MPKVEKVSRAQSKTKSVRWLFFDIQSEDKGIWNIVAYCMLLGGIGYLLYGIWSIYTYVSFLGYYAMLMSEYSGWLGYSLVNPGSIFLLGAHVVFSIILIVLGSMLLRKIKQLR